MHALDEPFKLAHITVNPASGAVETGHETLRLQPKVMEVLVFLTERHGQVVSKEAILESVWAGRFVVDDALRRCIMQIRKAFGESAKSPRWLETVPRRGYRLKAAPEPLASAETNPSAEVETIHSAEPAMPHAGAPFRGLQPFDAKHAAFFFGRRVEKEKTVAALRQQLRQNRGFVLMLGPSGSGKSSLAKAALLPELLTDGSLDLPGIRCGCHFSVSASPQVPLQQLAKRIGEAVALPDVDADGFAKACAEDADNALVLLIRSLDRLDGEARLVVLLDQFEEWFSYPNIDADTQRALAALLYAFARSGRVWIVAVMRSEFYPRFMLNESLRLLKSPDGQVDIGFPQASQIADIVRAPAQLAGLSYETTASGHSLDQVIIDEASVNPASLPLLQFALEQLYLHRDGNLLRAADLESLGGLAGCLGQHAELTFANLSSAARDALPDVLAQMLTVSADLTRVTRRSAFIDQFPANTAAGELITAMINARLFATYLDESSSRPMVQLVHEAVISHWARASAWVELNSTRLRFRHWLDESAKRWQASGRRQGDLLNDGPTLIEARSLAISEPELEPVAAEFVQSSVFAAQRSARRSKAVGTSLAVLAILAVVFGLSSARQTQLAEQRRLSAMSEAERARAVTEFIVPLFGNSESDASTGQPLTAIKLLDRAARWINAESIGSPESKGALLVTIAEAYAYAGRTDDARELVDSALQLHQQMNPVLSRVPADIHLENAGLLRQTEDFAQALSFVDQAIGLAQQHAEPWLVIEAKALRGLIVYQSGEAQEAQRYLSDVLDAARSLGTVQPRVLATLHNSLSLCHLDLKELDQAERHLSEALRLDERSGPVRYGAQASRLINLAAIREEQGRAADAATHYERAIALLASAYSDTHPQIAIALLNLGTLQLRSEGLETAYPYFERASQITPASRSFLKPLVDSKLALCATLLDRDATKPVRSDIVASLASAHGADHRLVLEARAAILVHELRQRISAEKLEELSNIRDGLAADPNSIQSVTEALDAFITNAASVE